MMEFAIFFTVVLGGCVLYNYVLHKNHRWIRVMESSGTSYWECSVCKIRVRHIPQEDHR